MSNFHIHPPRAPLPRHFTKPSFWKIHEIRISFLTIPFLIFCFNRKIILYISWNPKQNVYFANSLTGVPTPVLQHIVHIRIRGKGYTTLYQICYGLNSLSHLLQSLNICTVLHFLLSPFFLAPPFTFHCLYYLLTPFFALPPFTLFWIRLPFTFLCTIYFLLSPYFVLPFSTFLCTSSFYISLNFLLLPYIVLPPLTFLCTFSFHLFFLLSAFQWAKKKDGTLRPECNLAFIVKLVPLKVCLRVYIVFSLVSINTVSCPGPKGWKQHALFSVPAIIVLYHIVQYMWQQYLLIT